MDKLNTLNMKPHKIKRDFLSKLDTKYPILLLHGMGFKGTKHIGYWGRIPKVLEEHGAKVIIANQDANGSIEGNALQIEKLIEDIHLNKNVSKVNIIAHSKGGLEARYLISSLGQQDRIASLTTLATPHNGSKTVDMLMRFPQFIIKFGCKVVDLFFRVTGDKSPQTYNSIVHFKTDMAKEFNKNNPDSQKVYYQSYAFVMKNIFSDFLMWFSWLIVYLKEGPNDGLLTPKSVSWTNFQGVYRGNCRRGISHCDEVDLRRRRLTKKNGDGVSDITDLYLTIVSNLKEMDL
ncbi:MAG: alpha/beta hydrolase [Tenericutes bacterium]|nr:alpha/beta hydrolase [Mycoplasmatota bacterium]